MAEKKSFWQTVPGIVSGVAAIVTGLGVLIPIALKTAQHAHKTSGSQNPSAAVTGTAGTEGSTSTAGSSSASPGAPGGSNPLPTDSSSGAGSNPGGGGAGISADPPSIGFGSIQQGKTTPDKTVTITNPGSAPVTIDKVEIKGSDASAFAITSTTCGEGATVAPQ